MRFNFTEDKMQPFSLLTFSLLSNVLCFTQALEFIDCGSEKALALSVDLTPCDTNPCVLVKGTDITLEITFQSGAFMDAGRSRVQGVYEGRYLPAKYMETEICGHLNPPCPIYGGKKYTYTVSTYVSTGFQPISPDMRWELLRTDGSTFLCVQFPVQIKEPGS